LKLFSFSAWNTSLYALLSFKVSVEKSPVILIGLPLYFICFLSYSLQYSFSILCSYCFNDNMSWGSPILVKFVLCPGGFLNLNGHSFLQTWEIFCYYFVAYITNPFCLHPSLSSMPIILRFGHLMELVNSCIFLSQGLSCLTNSSLVFPLIPFLSSSSEILSSACSILLDWPPTVFLFHSFFWGFPYHNIVYFHI
jgi:hypothetical protein